ncbi:hypothetical protein KSD_00040 [Ktedonobacter sp. SOSP1-85]|nr:hypothetical protein KSD_00040 [Ktedonobacter sp. SOSP1-85]
MGLKTFKYRLYPTKVQSEKLDWTLARCCELYNAALQERREMYKYTGKGTTYNAQANQLAFDQGDQGRVQGHPLSSLAGYA